MAKTLKRVAVVGAIAVGLALAVGVEPAANAMPCPHAPGAVASACP
jgi:hypothetical protein